MPTDRYCGFGPQPADAYTSSLPNDHLTCAINMYPDVESAKCGFDEVRIRPNRFVASDETGDASDHLLETSMLTNKYDNRSPESLRNIMERRKCERLLLPDRQHNFVFFDPPGVQVYHTHECCVFQ